MTKHNKDLQLILPDEFQLETVKILKQLEEQIKALQYKNTVLQGYLDSLFNEISNLRKRLQ